VNNEVRVQKSNIRRPKGLLCLREEICGLELRFCYWKYSLINKHLERVYAWLILTVMAASVVSENHIALSEDFHWNHSQQFDGVYPK